MNFKIAGTKYYNNDYRVGSKITLEHDPSNVHDSNAIKVLNEDGDQLGHVPAAAAAVMMLLSQRADLSIAELFYATADYDDSFSMDLLPNLQVVERS